MILIVENLEKFQLKLSGVLWMSPEMGTNHEEKGECKFTLFLYLKFKTLPERTRVTSASR